MSNHESSNIIKIYKEHYKNEIINNIKTTFTPTGNFENDKARAEAYAKSVGMNEANTKIAVIMATQGPDEGAKTMLAEFNNDYFAMRAAGY
jgi:hypothetical protein